VHVIDGLATGDNSPSVVPMDDTSVDLGKNPGVIGASVLRNNKQSYVVASSATDGVSPTTMTYTVPSFKTSRHVVYDAPEASDGTSNVTASANSVGCAVTITAGSGKGFTGHPLVFSVAANTCAVTDIGDVTPPDIDGGTGSDGGSGYDAGLPSDPNASACGCTLVGFEGRATLGIIVLVPVLVLARRRARAPGRAPR